MENELAPVQPIDVIKFLHATSRATSAFRVFRVFRLFDICKFADKPNNVPIELTTICGRIFANIHTLPITPLEIHN